MTRATQLSQATLISGIRVPDSKLANEITEFIRDTESTLLFNHLQPRLLLWRTRGAAPWP
jgi:hypothetical protein